MTTFSSDRFLFVNSTRGLETRSARTLKELLSDLMENSGEEIAMWCEEEGKRVARVWREEKEREERGAVYD